MVSQYGSELQYSERINKKGRIVYSLLGETYPGYLNRYFVNKRYLKKYTDSDTANICEIGSANGAFSFWLSRNKKYKVVGMDCDRRLIYDCEHIRQKLNRGSLSFVCADATAKFSRDCAFDIIIASHVLEHVVNDTALLANAFNALKKGGILLLQVPYGDPGKIPLRDSPDSGHVREGYTEPCLRKKLEDVGFQIVIIGGSIGKIGRFAYRFARKSAQVKFVFNLSIIVFPLTLMLIHLEQIAAFFRRRELPFNQGPFVVARRPL